MRSLVLGHAAVTWFLVGLIWVVQVVVYPSFALVGRAEAPAFHGAHVARITSVVLLPMLLELLAAIALVFTGAVPRVGALLGLAAVGAVWLSTALVQVPLHEQLRHGLDPALVDRLVATNWVRTVLWSARGALAAWWVLEAR